MRASFLITGQYNVNKMGVRSSLKMHSCSTLLKGTWYIFILILRNRDESICDTRGWKHYLVISNAVPKMYFLRAFYANKLAWNNRILVQASHSRLIV